MSMSRVAVTVLILGAGCGGGGTKATAPAAPFAPTIALQPNIDEQSWYRTKSICAQGPFELDLDAVGGKWEEDFELRVQTPRKIALNAIILVDGVEVAKTSGVYDQRGTASGTADNTRCVADARERLTLGRAGGGGGGKTPGTPGTPGRLVVDPPAAPTVTAELELDTAPPTASIEVLRFQLRDRPAPGAKILIRFWSIEPNDLTGVRFGKVRIQWRPNVSEEAYEAHLAELAAGQERARLYREEQLRLQAERDEQRRRDEQAERDEAERRAREEAARRKQVTVTVKVDAEAERRAREEAARRKQVTVTVKVDAEAELRAYKQREAERRRRAAELAAEQERRARELEDKRRRAAIQAALEAERRAQRERFCATHPEDRDCWGAGGLKVKLQLDQRAKDRENYCLANTEDARCWSADERTRRQETWRKRVDIALQPPTPPDGPPPAPLAETVPPKLSVNADWRPGYWHWVDGTWVWLAGMWRVPEADIVAEQTTTAPAAPPPAQPEAPPAAPVRTAVWIGGFWQWNGTSWVWIAGSYQLRPAARVTWRAPEWRPRGSVHVLIPGGWVRLGGGR